VMAWPPLSRRLPAAGLRCQLDRGALADGAGNWMVLPRPKAWCLGGGERFQLILGLGMRPGPTALLKSPAWASPIGQLCAVTGSEAGGHLKLVGPAAKPLDRRMMGFSHFHFKGLKLARQVSQA